MSFMMPCHRRFRRMFARGALAAVVCPASCVLLQAQTTNATVSGSARDAQGAVVPGTTVTLTSDTQGAPCSQRSALTSSY